MLQFIQTRNARLFFNPYEIRSTESPNQCSVWRLAAASEPKVCPIALSLKSRLIGFLSPFQAFLIGLPCISCAPPCKFSWDGTLPQPQTSKLNQSLGNMMDSIVRCVKEAKSSDQYHAVSLNQVGIVLVIHHASHPRNILGAVCTDSWAVKKVFYTYWHYQFGLPKRRKYVSFITDGTQMRLPF